VSGLLLQASLHVAAIAPLGSTLARAMLEIRKKQLLPLLVEMQCQELLLLSCVLCTLTHASAALTAIFAEDDAFALHEWGKSSEDLTLGTSAAFLQHNLFPSSARLEFSGVFRNSLQNLRWGWDKFHQAAL
jgi:hypothetical protein